MACDAVQLAVSGVQELQPYQPGKPIEELERELGIENSIKLASNENPLGPSAKALAAAQDALRQMTLYPDALGFRLKKRLHEVYAIAPEQLTLGNGSNDLLELITRVFVNPGEEVIYSQYAFIVYALVSRAAGAKSIEVPAVDYGHDLAAMASAITPNTKLVFLANPNNPTGTAFTLDQLRQFLAQVPNSTLVVLDEAYTEYVEDSRLPDGLKLLDEYNNLIVTRTFSKAWGLAGLRVGFAAASSQITDLLNRVRQPFNDNIPALVAAEAVLDDQDYLQRSVALNRAGLQQLCTGLEALGIDYIPSYGNFVAVHFKDDAMPIYEALLRKGVIVRPLGIYKMPHHLRVSVGTESENQRFLDALIEVLNG